MEEKGGGFHDEPSRPVLIYDLSWRDGQWHRVKQRFHPNKCNILNLIINICNIYIITLEGEDEGMSTVTTRNVLAMDFTLGDGKTKSIRITDPKSTLTAATVETAMNTLLDWRCFFIENHAVRDDFKETFFDSTT